MINKTSRKIYAVMLIVAMIVVSCISWDSAIVANAETKNEQPNYVTTGKIAVAGSVNVRASYSTNSDIVGKLAKGDNYEILESNYTSETSSAKNTIWYKVKKDNLTGYIRADLSSIWHDAYAEGKTTVQANLRTGAGLGFKATGKVPRNTSVKVGLKVTAANGKVWYKVRHDGKSSYISSLYLSVDGTIGGQGTPSDTEGMSAAITTGKITASNATNIRKSHSTSSAIVGTLKQNTSFDVLEVKFTSGTSTAKTARWYKIKTSTITGYVRGDLISIWHKSYATGTATANVSARVGAGVDYEKTGTVPKGTKVKVALKAVAANGKEWYKVSANGSLRYVSSLYVSVGDSPADKPQDPDNETTDDPVAGETIGTVTATGSVNVRSGGSTASTSIGSLSKGTKFTIEEVKYTSSTSTAKNTMWYKIKTTALSGYVRADMASVWHKAYAAATTTGNVAVRTGAGVGFEKIGTVPKGTQVKVVLKAVASNVKGWYKISYNGGFKYVSSLYLSFEESEPPWNGEDEKPVNPTDPVDVPEGQAVIMSKGGATIRKSTSSSSASVGTLAYNTSVTVLEEKFTSGSNLDKSYKWYYIKTPSLTGFVRSDFLSIRHAKYVASRTTDTVNVRQGAGTGFVVTGTLSKGTAVKVVLKATGSNGSNWYKIYKDGAYRYVSSQYVSLNGTGDVPPDEGTFEQQLTAEGFPESYKVLLRQVHKAYPKWKFKAKQLNFTWADAFAKQTSNYRANTINSARPEPYKAVLNGTYNFTTHQYLSLDGPGWVAASKATVGHYMDPRNWLMDASGGVNGSIFMFEKQSYDPAIHTEAAVKRILSYTALPEEASSYYLEAARTYDISPIYLAIKTRLELGPSSFMIDGHSFTYGGKKYSDCYNVFNIGASDSPDGSAATKGLVYAAGGSDGSDTSNGRPWNTLKKAVLGGTQYIQENYKNANQYLPYYERFNVLGGLSSIGTYQYATSIFYASTQGQLIYQNYDELDVLSEGYVFEIPVYQSMPINPMAKPKNSGNNNCYLDSIKVSAEGKALTYSPTFNRFTGTYTINETVPATVNSLVIDTVTNVSDAKVTIIGNALSAGENKITVKCTSSTGIVKYYYIKVNKASY